jgi:hypothetical protein
MRNHRVRLVATTLAIIFGAATLAVQQALARAPATTAGIDKVLADAVARGDVARGIAGVILMQFLPFADSKALAVYDSFERAVYELK